MFTIKRAARLTGVPEPTLRAWERRYAVVSPHRTEAGYRLYDEAQVRVLRIMRQLVDDGWSPREAAAQAQSLVAADPHGVEPQRLARVAESAPDTEDMPAATRG